MKLVDKMKDENLGLAILYNFTKHKYIIMHNGEIIFVFLSTLNFQELKFI